MAAGRGGQRIEAVAEQRCRSHKDFEGRTAEAGAHLQEVQGVLESGLCAAGSTGKSTQLDHYDVATSND